MGISNIASHLIMFIAVLTISTVVVGVFNNYVDTTTSAVKVQQDWLSNQLKTAIKIEVVSYDSSTNTTTAYVENTGATILDVNDSDVFIDGQRIPRETANRTIGVVPDTEVADIGKWNPKEEVEIQVFEHLAANVTHKLIVTTPYQGMDTEEFSS